MANVKKNAPAVALGRLGGLKGGRHEAQADGTEGDPLSIRHRGTFLRVGDGSDQYPRDEGRMFHG